MPSINANNHMTGEVKLWAGNTIPDGFLSCDGSAVSRTTYAALFSALGTTWGIGDGSTTFNLPDFRGRAVIGVGTGPSLTARALGASGGAETHVLSVGELANHAHTYNTVNGTPAGFQGGPNGFIAITSIGVPASTTAAGGNDPHNNMQPFAVAHYIIKT